MKMADQSQDPMKQVIYENHITSNSEVSSDMETFLPCCVHLPHRTYEIPSSLAILLTSLFKK